MPANDVTPQEAQPVGSAQTREVLDGEVSIVDLLNVVIKHKSIVVGLPVIAATLTLIITFLMPNIYTATARILPPQVSHSSAAALLGQLGPFGGLLGNFGIRNSNELYAGMLKSRTVGDALIARFALKRRYNEKTMVATRQALREVTDISVGKDGIISIRVDDRSPKLAAAMANAYVAELMKLNSSLAVTAASRRRLFFQAQVKQAKTKLNASEAALREMEERTGFIRPDTQGTAIIDAIAKIKAQIAAKEVQIGAMKSFATRGNPTMVRAKRELSGLQQQLHKLEHGRDAGTGSVFIPTRRVPEVGLQYLRRLRAVKFDETMYGLLAKQYELARIDEGQDPSLVQVLDKAVPPDQKSKPRRVLLVVLVALVAGIVALLTSFLLEAIEQARRAVPRSQRT